MASRHSCNSSARWGEGRMTVGDKAAHPLRRVLTAGEQHDLTASMPCLRGPPRHPPPIIPQKWVPVPDHLMGLEPLPGAHRIERLE